MGLILVLVQNLAQQRKLIRSRDRAGVPPADWRPQRAIQTGYGLHAWDPDAWRPVAGLFRDRGRVELDTVSQRQAWDPYLQRKIEPSWGNQSYIEQVDPRRTGPSGCPCGDPRCRNA